MQACDTAGGLRHVGRAHLLGACCEMLACSLAVHKDAGTLNDQVHVLQAKTMGSASADALFVS